MTDASTPDASTPEASLPDADDTSTDAATGGSRRGLLAAFVLGAVVLVVAGFIVATVAINSGSTFAVVIPAGTGEAIDAGEPVDAVPSVIELNVGDTLEIVNDDTRPHVLGPWTVLPGEEVTYTFDQAEDFSAACSAHVDRAVRIRAT